MKMVMLWCVCMLLGFFVGLCGCCVMVCDWCLCLMG